MSLTHAFRVAVRPPAYLDHPVIKAIPDARVALVDLEIAMTTVLRELRSAFAGDGVEQIQARAKAVLGQVVAAVFARDLEIRRGAEEGL